MRRTYSPRRNIGSLVSELSWGARVLCVVLFMLFVRMVWPNAFFVALHPILSSADASVATTRALMTGLTSAGALTTERDALKNELAQTRTELDSVKQQLSQLEGLVSDRAMVERVATSLVATVIARPPQSPYDTLLIAAGSATGARVGMEVFASTGTPIGVVDRVTDDYATVRLFTSSGEETLGWIGSKATPVTLRGTGGGTFSVAVTRPSSAAVGDHVYVPGPQMLPIGIVSRIDDDPSLPSITLRIVPVANLFSIPMVMLRDTGFVSSSVNAATSTRP